MSTPEARAREEKLATEFNKQIADWVATRRLWYGIFAVVMFCIGGRMAYLAQPMLAFLCVVTGLIGVTQCLDAHGHLQEVRRRSNKTLYPRMSVLDRHDPGSAAKTPAP